tara:strand:- start:3399 stop:4796 length:1398 start_codon:yes stop_codon:yes gene_type:complete
MKFFLFLIISFFSIQIVTTQVFDVEAIEVTGDNDKRINLVIMGDGYQTTEFPKFITDASSFTNEMFTQSPFIEYANYFNVYAIKVPSNQSGADHPGTATDPNVTEPVFPIADVDTYFNTSFDTNNIHRLLYTFSSSIIYNTLANYLPEYDQPIILVNTSQFGGAGGAYAVSYTGSSANETIIHELGHSLFNLRDEYYAGDQFAREGINMTQETNTSLVKWKNWLNTNGVGIYPYGNNGTAATWFRPHQNCKMRYLNAPFCSVCKEAIIEKIHSLVSPIDAYTPTSNTLDNSSFPINFALSLIKPIPNTLESEWTLNVSSFGSNVDDIAIQESDLIVGINTLTAAITDATSFLKVDNHDSFHVYTVTWTIDNTTLGIEDITTETNTLNISMFPNPTNDFVNFKLESEKVANLKLEIIALDGKKIRTEPLSNFETYQLDISSLNSGIYITNFYSNNVLIASKKLVKN